MSAFVKCMTETYGISQKELASMLGVTSSAVSQWESAESISIEILYKLSRLFQISVDELLSGMLPDGASAAKLREEFEWLRTFKIDAAIAMKDGRAANYFAAYRKLKSRYFELMYRRVTGKLRDAWRVELDYLSAFFTYNADHAKTPDEAAFLAAFSNNNGNKRAIIWELEQAYKCSLKLHWTACFESGDPKIYLAAYDCLNSIEKDEIVTAFRYINFRWLPADLRKRQGRNLHKFIRNTVFEMINCGGRVRYNVGHDLSSCYGTPQKGRENKLRLVPLPVPHIKSTDGIEVLRVLDKWNEAEKILSAVDGSFTHAKATDARTVRYDEYIKAIDEEEMQRIENAYKADKENTAIKDPIKYWDMVKNNRIWVAAPFN